MLVAFLKGAAGLLAFLVLAAVIMLFFQWIESMGVQDRVCGGIVWVCVVLFIVAGCASDAIKWIRKKWHEAEVECSE
jgi:hypothetical protein